MTALGAVFQVRLCNFKATGVHQSPAAAPPFCVRGNFDGRAFNSEYFHSSTMAPIWALDTSFDYQAATIESLRNKFLVLECYGADRFLGMARIDLFSLATGPTAVELAVKEGAKMNGILAFEAQFQQVSSIQIQLARICIRSIASRGYEGLPNPYLSFNLSGAGQPLESAIAPDAVSPEWERLPAVHFRGTFQALCDQRLRFDLRHSRNGYTAGITDPSMAVFELSLSSLPIEFGRDCSIPFREMVHSAPSYPFPFSAECIGLLEVRNLPQVVQLKGGVLTDSGIVGGVPRVATIVTPQETPILDHISPRRLSPPRAREPRALPVSDITFDASPIVYSHGVDMELLNEVAAKQQSLLSTVQERLRQISRRKAEVTNEIANAKAREEEHLEGMNRRRHNLQADLRAAQLEKSKLEQQLKTIALRREEAMQTSTTLATERERSRRAIEVEQQEVNQLQERVNQLRHEMTRHLEEEESRYAQRVREAEEARRRAQRDAEDLAALEAKLTNAEHRMQKGITALRSFSPRRM